MLYDRWRQVAAARAGETALLDAASRERWTFRRLAGEAEKTDPGGTDPRHPRGTGASFVLAVLRAWRAGAFTCPLEAGQLEPAIPVPPPGIVHLKLTSATTGAPRLVAFTAEQLAADADNIVRTMGLRPDWPNLAAISLAHSYGFSNIVLPLLLHGVPFVQMDSTLPEALRVAAALVPDATLPAVPALWRAWHDAGAIPANVRLAISAGAPLPLPLELEVFERSGLKIHNFYGATECGGITYDRSPKPREDTACTGAALDNVTLAVGTDGCLEVRGRAVGETYWPEPAPNLERGVYRASDLVDIEGGSVFLRGRASDLINVAGRKLSPETVERALQAHPGVRECLVFGAPEPDSERGEIIVACVVGAPLPEQELRRFLLERLADWQVPRRWHWVESLEANPRGKLSRAGWRQRLGYAQ
jgi:acyl-coenzyme A synthetase/AMP-(fatty) acid ligase